MEVFLLTFVDWFLIWFSGYVVRGQTPRGFSHIKFAEFVLCPRIQPILVCIFCGHLKPCILLLLGGAFCKWWLDPVGGQHSILPHPCWFSVSCSIKDTQGSQLTQVFPFVLLHSLLPPCFFGLLTLLRWLCFWPLSTLCCFSPLTFLWRGFLFIYLNVFFYIGVSPINNVVAVSGEQLRGSAPHTRVHSPPNSPPIQAEQRSQRCTAGPCRSPMLNQPCVRVHPQPPNYPFPHPSPQQP